jgi:hypothetical protein
MNLSEEIEMQIEIITKQNRIDALEAALKVAEDRNLATTSLVTYGTLGVIGTVVTTKVAKAIAINVRDSYNERRIARKAAKTASIITADDIAAAMVKAVAEFEALNNSNTATPATTI